MPVNSNFSPKIGCRGNVPQHLLSIETHNPNGISIGSVVFAQMTAECPFPLKIAPSHWRYGTPSNTWFPGPTRVLNPNGILIGAAVFAGLTSVTDRPQTDQPTDHATRSVTTGRIYTRSTAMWPNNSKWSKYNLT